MDSDGIKDPSVKALATFISSPTFQSTFENFFLRHALNFSDEPEHRLDYMEVYHEFQELFQKFMTEFYEAEGIDEDDFAAKCQQAMNNDSKANEYLDIVLASMDYHAFYRLMLAMRGRAAAEQRRSGSKRPLPDDASSEEKSLDTSRDPSDQGQDFAKASSKTTDDAPSEEGTPRDGDEELSEAKAENKHIGDSKSGESDDDEDRKAK